MPTSCLEVATGVLYHVSLWHDFTLHVAMLVCVHDEPCSMSALLRVLPVLLPLCFGSRTRCYCHDNAVSPPATAKAAPIASAFPNRSFMLLVVGFGIC